MKLAIYCCGGHGRELLVLANNINSVYRRWDEIIFADDNIRPSFPVHNRVLTFEEIKANYNKSDCEFIIASGEPYLLKSLSNKILTHNYNLTTLIADDVKIGNDIQVNQGCIIQEKVVITVSVNIGMSTCVGISTVLHHDVSIGNYCFIATHSTICGNVVIGDGTFIGAGSVIREEIDIGSNCVVGMGSVVVDNIPNNSVFYGNPARVVRCNSEQGIFSKKR
jgi:sugar O-acyltransferase (sialic acid O-acetyltransferase NeuD family)